MHVFYRRFSVGLVCRVQDFVGEFWSSYLVKVDNFCKLLVLSAKLWNAVLVYEKTQSREKFMTLLLSDQIIAKVYMKLIFFLSNMDLASTHDV